MPNSILAGLKDISDYLRLTQSPLLERALHPRTRTADVYRLPPGRNRTAQGSRGVLHSRTTRADSLPSSSINALDRLQGFGTFVPCPVGVICVQDGLVLTPPEVFLTFSHFESSVDSCFLLNTTLVTGCGVQCVGYAQDKTRK